MNYIDLSVTRHIREAILHFSNVTDDLNSIYDQVNRLYPDRLFQTRLIVRSMINNGEIIIE